jgi:TatD DNase family protein
MIDSHCHLADEAFAQDLSDVAVRARDAGLTATLCILSADEPEEVDRASVVASAWPATRFAAAVHPHRAGPYHGRVPDALAATRAAVIATDARAIGETGLDYHYDFAPRAVQQEVFAGQIALAVELGRPIVVHTREAFDDTLAVIQEAGQHRVRGVMHCFSGTLAEARRAVDIGFVVSLAGILTFPKAGELRDVARALPLDHLLVETDAPFLAPVPYRGKRNEPAWVARTLVALAEARHEPVEEMDAAITENFSRFLGLR